MLGTLAGLAAAVGYTVANSLLRSVAFCDPVWVSAVKAFPNLVLVAPWLLVHLQRGQPVFPRRDVLAKLILAALAGQLLGNVFFQWSLGLIGLALTVPLSLGTIILFGALLGRIFLHEPITARMALAVSVLIAAICVLSLGAGDAQRSVAASLQQSVQGDSWWIITCGVGAAVLSGVAYAVLGVVIRYGVNGRASLAATLVIVGVVGTASLGAVSLWRIGWDGMWSTSTENMAYMLMAGIMNTAAFLALTRALQLANLLYVNAINATQATMAAVAGVLFFQEALSSGLCLGVLMTIVGLLMMRR